MQLQTSVKKRELNIEILRIISMVLVLLNHSYWNAGFFKIDMVHSDLLLSVGVLELYGWIFVCVPCFIVISGYFGIRWKWKGLFNYLFQIGFWGGLVYLLTWGMGMHAFEPLRMLKNMACFLHGVNWFFPAYLGLYMLAPILNAFIEKADEKQMRNMTLAFFLFQTVFGWIGKSSEFYYGLTTTSLIGWYLIGGWIRKSTWKGFHLKPWQNMAVFLGVGQICVLVALAAAYMGIEKGTYSYISPLQVIQTTYLFLFCRSLKVSKGEKVITFFASSAFAGLLAHSWEGGAIYGGVSNWISENLPAPFIFAMLWILLFFSGACCLDKLRIFCWNKVVKVCFKH